MTQTRKQLTLFIGQPEGIIEKIRAEFNPKQHHLIPAHVTLCREDELDAFDTIIERITSISFEQPIQVNFASPERFDNGKGVFIPATAQNDDFYNLRQLLLGTPKLNNTQSPHITLMHPRNSTCTDTTFKIIKKQKLLPTTIHFDTVSLIEQINTGKWNVLKEFNIVKTNK